MRRTESRGFTLVEALVALLVLSVGIIGVAALHGQSLAASRAAIFRSQAVALTGDIAERIRLNRGAQSAYEGEGEDRGCDATNVAGCTSAEMAAHDLFVWRTEIERTLPRGQGSIRVDTSTRPATYTVTVSWDDATAGATVALPISFQASVY